MPFPIVYGVPRSDLKVLRVLRQEIIELKTGMFGGDKRDLVTMRKVTYELARVVWRYFNGQYEVEVFIGDLDGETKTLIKPATGQRTLGV